MLFRTRRVATEEVREGQYKSWCPHPRDTHKSLISHEGSNYDAKCAVGFPSRRRFVSMPLASINSLNSRSTSSATFASISSSVRGKLTTGVSPVTGLRGSLVVPLRSLVGEHVRQNSLCKTLRLTHAFSCMSRPAMQTRKICNSSLAQHIYTLQSVGHQVPLSVKEVAHDHIPQRGARFRETGARLRTLSNSVKAWLIAYHECAAVRILCVARCVEIQAIARFKSGRPHQPTHTHTFNPRRSASGRMGTENQ